MIRLKITVLILLFLNLTLQSQVSKYPKGMILLLHCEERLPGIQYTRNEIYEFNSPNTSVSNVACRFIPGKFGFCFFPNGDYSLQPPNFVFNKSQSHTINMWIYFRGFRTWNGLVSYPHTSTSAIVIGTLDDYPYVQYGSNDISPSSVTATTKVSMATWIMLTWTTCYTQNIIRIYMNGKIIGEQSFTGSSPYQSGGTCRLGNAGPGSYMLAYFDELSFFNRCLSPSEVLDFYYSYTRGEYRDD